MMQTEAQRIQCSHKLKELIANQLSRYKVIDCVGDYFSQGAGMPGSQRDIAFSQLAVKRLRKVLASGRKIMIQKLHKADVKKASHAEYVNA